MEEEKTADVTAPPVRDTIQRGRNRQSQGKRKGGKMTPDRVYLLVHGVVHRKYETL